MILYLMKIIKSQKKIYITVLSILILLSSFEFVLLGIYSSFSQELNLNNILIRLISSIAVFVAFFLTLMINNFFIENKYEEFSIILLSGSRTRTVIQYIVLQFGLLFVLADLLGIGLGYIFMEIVNRIQPYQFVYSVSSLLFVYAGILICKIIYVLMINLGKFVRIKLNIADFLTHHTSMTSKKNYFSGKLFHQGKKKYPIKEILLTLIGILILVTSIQGIFDMDNDSLLSIYFMLFLAGEIILINTTIPLVFDFLHDRYLMKAPRLILILSNIMQLSKVLIAMINIMAVVIPICLSNFLFGILSNEIKTVTILCFYILLIMIVLSFILRFQVYLPAIEKDIATLKAIGYQYRELLFVYNNVVFGFMLIIVILPLILYSLLLYRTCQIGYLTLEFAVILIFSYFIVFTLLAIYMMYEYHLTVKEAYHDVKYLNRSE